MKKLFAIALTVVMLFAVCVPAFASTTITDKTANTADANIYTSTTPEEGFVAYSVTIPANTEIPWGKTKTPFTYSVKTHLELGKRLTITAVSNGTQEMTNAGTDKTLPYTFSKTNDGPVVDNLNYTTETEVVDMNRTFNINIDTAAWTAAPIAQYSDTLTFTVEVVDATPVAP